MIKERPIGFKGQMVAAILNDSKSQMRRTRGFQHINVSPDDYEFMQLAEGSDGKLRAFFLEKSSNVEIWINCPYGKPGDRLIIAALTSRILLEITDIRVERLQDISEDDAQAEGVGKLPPFMDEGGSRTAAEMLFRSGFRDIWESISGPDSWQANPWVWCISFSRIEITAIQQATEGSP